MIKSRVGAVEGLCTEDASNKCRCAQRFVSLYMARWMQRHQVTLVPNLRGGSSEGGRAQRKWHFRYFHPLRCDNIVQYRERPRPTGRFDSVFLCESRPVGQRCLSQRFFLSSSLVGPRSRRLKADLSTYCAICFPFRWLRISACFVCPSKVAMRGNMPTNGTMYCGQHSRARIIGPLCAIDSASPVISGHTGCDSHGP